MTGADLLARTIFYKVGHHGSRNATLREGGLELMTDPSLIAFIPTDEAMAKKVRWKDIPGDRVARAAAHADRRAADPVGRGVGADSRAWRPRWPGGGADPIAEVVPGLCVELELG